MADLNYKDMSISVKKFGEHDFTIKLRSLNKTFTPDEMASLIYPTFDAEEKALNAPQPASSGDSGPVSS